MKSFAQSFDNLFYSILNKFSKLKWVKWLFKADDFPPKLYTFGNLLRNLTFAVLFFWLMIRIAFHKNFQTVIVPSAFVIFYGLLYLAFWKKFLEFLAGYWGEKKVQKILETIDSTKTLNNIMLPGNSGNIDHLVFLPQGILPVETKSWMGEIEINKKYWVRKFGDKKFVVKPTPLNQVWGCEQNLKRFLKQNNINENIVLPGIVVFAIEPDKVNWYIQETRVLNRNQLKPYIENILQRGKGNREEIVKAYRLLKIVKVK